MITALLFVVASAAGAVIRSLVGSDEWRTAALNVVGSFLLGLMSEWSSPALTIAGVGALGSLTTFSGFISHWVDQLETNRAEDDRPTMAILFAVVSLAGGISAAYLGLEIATR